MKTVLVTGVAGFIGSHLADRLLADGFTVIGCDDLSSGNISYVNTACEFIEIDLSCEKQIARIPRQVDIIAHCAGHSSGALSFVNPAADLDRNTKVH